MDELGVHNMHPADRCELLSLHALGLCQACMTDAARLVATCFLMPYQSRCHCCHLVSPCQAFIRTLFPNMAAEKSWRRRFCVLGWLCCSSRAMNAAAGRGGGTPLERAAIGLSSVTQQMDMHCSDSVAAFLLASQLQRCRRMLALEVL